MGTFTKTVIYTSVFQDGPNGGNPCPVVLDGDDLKTEQGKYLFSVKNRLLFNPFNKGNAAGTKNGRNDRRCQGAMEKS